MYHQICFWIDCRDSSETIDHSSGDVAYLRLTAHTESKPEISTLKMQPKSIFEDDFQTIYDTVIKMPRIPSVLEPFKLAQMVVETKPRIVQIGDGVFVTDSISPPASYSVDQGIRHCFDNLTSTPSHNNPKYSPPPTTPSLLPQHNHNHSPSAGHVRLHPRQSNLLNLLPLPPAPLPSHNLNTPPLKSQSLRHNKHPSTNRPARPIPQLLGPCQHRSLLSINFCTPSLSLFTIIKGYLTIV